MKLGAFQHRSRRRSSHQGYILVILTLFVALAAFATLATAPRMVQQLRRDREEEMIHRGAQYARAIRKFVKKNGVYPTSLDQLENTNHVRYLRRRYKDPFSPDGKWRLLHIGDVPFMGAGQTTGQTGQTGEATSQQTQPGALLGQTSQPSQSGALLGQSMAGSSTLGQSLGQIGTQLGVQSAGTLGSGISSGLAGGKEGPDSQQNAQGASSQPQAKAQAEDNKNSSGTSATGGMSSQPSTPQQGITFGGGAILGVASASERQGIKEFNGKNKYKEWYFVYDPASEAASPGGGALIIGPYTRHRYGNNGGGIGTPASQIASPNQPSGFGQPIGQGFGGTSGPASSTTGSSSPSSPSSGSNSQQSQ
jgi:hypothetical protein